MAAANQNFVITHDGFACDITCCPSHSRQRLQPKSPLNIFLTMLSPLTFTTQSTIALAAFLAISTRFLRVSRVALATPPFRPSAAARILALFLARGLVVLDLAGS